MQQTNTTFEFTQLVNTDNTFPLTVVQPDYFPYTFDEHPLIKTIKDIQQLIILCQSFEARIVHKHKLHISRIESILFKNANVIPSNVYFELMNAIID